MNKSILATATAALGLVMAAAACASPAQSQTIQLATLNGSGVTGTVTLTDIGSGRSRVDVRVEPAGNLDMPAHIHPGACDNLVPQPRYPLRNVVNGVSTTDVPASLTELLAGDLAVNLHRSNPDLQTYTACAELRSQPSGQGVEASPGSQPAEATDGGPHSMPTGPHSMPAGPTPIPTPADYYNPY